MDNALQHLGPLLSQALIYNIGGNAARSELDKLSEPVKRLIVRQVNSKSWFEAALLGDSFPSDKVSVKDRIVFLQKVLKYVNPMSLLRERTDVALTVSEAPGERTRWSGTFGWLVVV
jgi:hypothetical protein